MSFREKSAWITLITAVICFGVYFGAIATGEISGRGFGSLRLLLACTLSLLQGALTLVAAMTTPRAGRAPRDEREALIQARSHTLGHYVLLALVLALAGPLHMGHPALT